MRFIFALGLGILLSAVVAYTVLGLIRLVRLVARSDIFAATIAVVVLLVLVASLPQVALFSRGPEVGQAGVHVVSAAGTPRRSANQHEERSGRELQHSAAADASESPDKVNENEPERPPDTAAPPEITAEGKTQAKPSEPAAAGSTQATVQASTSKAGESGASEPESTKEGTSGDRVAISKETAANAALESGTSRENSSGEGAGDRRVWDKLQPADWVGKTPFFLEDGQSLAWPVSLGPYVEPTEPPSIGELRRRLSGPWFYWLVEEAPHRTSRETAGLLFASADGSGRERPWERRIRWLPPELWDELMQACHQAIARYIREELGRELPQLPHPDWIAENLVRDMYWEILQPSGSSRPVVLEASDASAQTLAIQGEAVRFRLHVLLGFDGDSRGALAVYLRQVAIHDLVARLIWAMAALTGTFALGYLGLRSEKKLGDRGRRLLWGFITLGCFLCLLGAIRALAG